MSLSWSAHISWLFTERPYLERVAAARAAGFAWIETAWPADPRQRELLPAAVAEQGVGVALLNCNAGDVEHGERGFLNDPARRQELERDFLAAAELAERLGARNVNVLVGRALPGIALSRQHAAVLDALRSLAATASARGLRVLLEPINEIENPGYLAPRPADVAELVALSDSAAVGLLLDVYHLARGGDDPLAAIERYGPLIGHVQISDCPGRGQPGTGALELGSILERLDGSGYEGPVGLEYAPRGSSEVSLAFLRDERFPVGL